jgi:hypothetical protein
MKLSCIMETLTSIACLPHVGVRPIEWLYLVMLAIGRSQVVNIRSR